MAASNSSSKPKMLSERSSNQQEDGDKGKGFSDDKASSSSQEMNHSKCIFRSSVSFARMISILDSNEFEVYELG